MARDVTGGRTGFTGLGWHVRITATGFTGPVRLDAATVPGTR
ncbi:hypothetical protein BC793_106270 [Actinoplanes xinjiangensis]|uniref:Uncharacterized protein n=1 Tax=Actinoplanes xinjiangensis TaxID=512350 RepID=A0A316FKD5_9ACTN|nr:hypothetical protein BC793_106270 [Actinoplanes xinjiangensis]GIF39005.1 hypothetical protein Axi01nite_33160 [Actinoplanes xinjiangensis]